MPSEHSGQGYLTDVGYVRQFCSELNPAMWRAVAALAGCPPPPGNDFDYCEIGAGYGDTVATLAAAYPRARFVGIDVNPKHVEFARTLASRGDVDNVRFLQSDFEALPAGGLPPLDYVCAHGLLTWIAPEKRAALFARASAWLKPGGLLYVGYNALPGWAAVEPLRRLMLDAAASVAGGSEARVRHALAAAKRLREEGAAYFIANPSAKEILDTMLEMGVPYAAHEFFHAHWEPMYFADVAEEAAAHDLRFVGQLPLHLNYADLAVAPTLGQALRAASGRRAWEQLKAFANNEFFRRDVYVKGAVPRADDTMRAYVDATRFGTLVAADQVKREASFASCTLRFAGPLFDAVVAALARRASTIEELAAEPSLAGFGVEAIRQAVLQLLMGQDVVPARSHPPAPAQTGSSFHVPSAFNRAILAQSLARNYTIVLASPVAGTGVVLSKLHAVALRLLTEAPPDARGAWLRAFIETSPPLRVWDHDRPLETPEDRVRVLTAEFERFLVARLPKLVELGIVEGSAPPSPGPSFAIGPA